MNFCYSRTAFRASLIFSLFLGFAAAFPHTFLFYRGTRIGLSNSEELSTDRISYGRSCWDEIAREKFFYVDKTKAIKDLERFAPFCCLWRPRRSGKSLFCQQLASYYDIAVKEKDFKTLFEHTYIGDQKNLTAKRGKYYILPLNFSGVSPDGDVLQNFRKYINLQVSDFIERYPEVCKNVIVDPDDHLASLGSLINAINRAKKQIYVIADEFDAFANALLFNVDTSKPDMGRAQYESIVSEKNSILRNFANTLKIGTDNGAIRRMFFTGVAPVAFSDGLSSLNMVVDVSSRQFFETTFGFTADEVSRALALVYPRNSSLFNNSFAEMQSNFDGYRFNMDQKTAIFNPQMCLYYLNEIQNCGQPPSPILDQQLSDRMVPRFLIKNYRQPYNPFSLVLGIFTTTKNMGQPFRSEVLFNRETADDALTALAFYLGFLTYANPDIVELKGKLVAPNIVFKELFVDTIFNKLPETYMSRLWDILAIPDKKAQIKELKQLKTEASGDKLQGPMVKKFVNLITDQLFKASTSNKLDLLFAWLF